MLPPLCACEIKLALQHFVPLPINLEGLEFAQTANFAYFSLGGIDFEGKVYFLIPPPPHVLVTCRQGSPAQPY